MKAFSVKKILFLSIVFIFMIYSGSVKSQIDVNAIMPSKLVFLSVDTLGEPFSAYTGDCFIFLNYSNGDFTIKSDASNFKTNDSQTDSILEKKGPQAIVFKSNIADQIYRFNMREDSGNMYDMKGILSINDVEADCVAQFDPMNFGNKSDTKSYRIDFRLTLEADKIKIRGFENKISERVLFEIARGVVNVIN